MFQAAFCFVLSNVIQVVRNYLAQAQQCLPETISTQLLFEDIQEEWTAWHKFLTPSQTLAWLELPSSRELLTVADDDTRAADAKARQSLRAIASSG